MFFTEEWYGSFQEDSLAQAEVDMSKLQLPIATIAERMRTNFTQKRTCLQFFVHSNLKKDPVEGFGFEGVCVHMVSSQHDGPFLGTLAEGFGFKGVCVHMVSSQHDGPFLGTLAEGFGFKGVCVHMVSSQHDGPFLGTLAEGFGFKGVCVHMVSSQHDGPP